MHSSLGYGGHGYGSILYGVLQYHLEYGIYLTTAPSARIRHILLELILQFGHQLGGTLALTLHRFLGGLEIG